NLQRRRISIFKKDRGDRTGRENGDAENGNVEKRCRGQRQRSEIAMLAFLIGFDWNKLRPEAIFGGQVLERTPAGLTIAYIIGVGVLIGFLVLTFYDNFNRPKFLYERDLPR